MPDLSHIAEPLHHLAVDIGSLTPDPRNARKHDRQNLDAIKTSLTRFGQVEPLVVQRQGMIVRAGNGRLQVAKELGWKHVAAVVVDQNDADAIAFAIADNRTSELGQWDYGTLMSLLESVNVPVSDLGFQEEELGAIQADLLASGEIDSAALFGEKPASINTAPVSLGSAKTESNDAPIRRVMLYMSQDQYDRTVELLTAAMNDLGCESHSEAVLGALEKLYG